MMINLLTIIPLYPNNFQFFHKIFLPIPWINSLQLPIVIDKLQFSYHLHHNKKTGNPKTTIDDKVTFHFPPAPDASLAAPNNSYAWYPVLTVSNSPYSLKNHNQYFKITPDTKKQEKHENWW